MGRKKKEPLIRTTPFTALKRKEHSYEAECDFDVECENTREWNADELAYRRDRLREGINRGTAPTADELAEAERIDAWLQIKPGDDVTDAIKVSFQNYVKLFLEAWDVEPIRDLRNDEFSLYVSDSYSAWFCEQTWGVLSELIDDLTEFKRAEYFERFREEQTKRVRDLFKRVEGLVFKDYLTWFESTIWQLLVVKSGERVYLTFTDSSEPTPLLTGKNNDVVVMYA